MAAEITACAKWIGEVMKRRGIRQLGVANKLGQDSNGLVNAVLKGKRAVPLESLEDWIRALGLSTEEARTFRRLALRSYAPQYVQELVDELDATKDELAELKRALEAREGDAP